MNATEQLTGADRGCIEYRLPLDSVGKFPELFRMLEAASEGNAMTYGLSMSTLEEVFLQFAENDHKLTSESPTELATVDIDMPEATASDKEASVNVDELKPGWFQQLCALIRKRFQWGRRDMKSTLLVIVMPLLTVAVSYAFQQISLAASHSTEASFAFNVTKFYDNLGEPSPWLSPLLVGSATSAYPAATMQGLALLAQNVSGAITPTFLPGGAFAIDQVLHRWNDADAFTNMTIPPAGEGSLGGLLVWPEDDTGALRLVYNSSYASSPSMLLGLSQSARLTAARGCDGECPAVQVILSTVFVAVNVQGGGGGGLVGGIGYCIGEQIAVCTMHVYL